MMRTIRMNEPDTPGSIAARIRQNERNIAQLKLVVERDSHALGALVSPWKVGDVLVHRRRRPIQRAKVEEIWSTGTWNSEFTVFHRLCRLRKDGSEGAYLYRLHPWDVSNWRKESESDEMADEAQKP